MDHLPGCFNRYALPRANMGLGSGPAEIDAILRREIPWRRWMLRHLLDDPTVSATDLRNAFGSWEHGLVRAALGAGDAPSDVLCVTEEERARGVLAAQQGAAALRAGDPDRATRLLMRALGEDPFNGAARYDLQVALHQAAGCLAPGAADPLALRTHVTLVAAAVLVRDPDLLAAYAARTTAHDDATLVVTYDSAAELPPSWRRWSSASVSTARPRREASSLSRPRPRRRPGGAARGARRRSARRAVAGRGRLSRSQAASAGALRMPARKRFSCSTV